MTDCAAPSGAVCFGIPLPRRVLRAGGRPGDVPGLPFAAPRRFVAFPCECDIAAGDQEDRQCEHHDEQDKRRCFHPMRFSLDETMFNLEFFLLSAIRACSDELDTPFAAYREVQDRKSVV